MTSDLLGGGGDGGDARRDVMRWLSALMAAQLVPLLALERRMTQTGGPGIIAFELAGPERAGEILERWGRDGMTAATWSLVLDFPFPATYATLNALACASSADKLAAAGRGRAARLGGPLAYAQLATAACDYVENLSLLAVLRGHRTRAPTVARRAALAKFALLGATGVYVAAGAIAGRSKR